MFLKLKLHSNFNQEKDSKQTLKFLNLILEGLISRLPLYLSKDMNNMRSLASMIVSVIGDEGE